MGKLTEELIEAGKKFELAKLLNEAKEAMGIDAIAKELGTTKQNIYRGLVVGMTKVYKQVKKEFKCTPAQAMKLMMEFLNADADEVLAYLDKDSKAEVDAYVRAHGAD